MASSTPLKILKAPPIPAPTGRRPIGFRGMHLLQTVESGSCACIINLFSCLLLCLCTGNVQPKATHFELPAATHFELPSVSMHIVSGNHQHKKALYDPVFRTTTVRLLPECFC